MKKTYLLAIPFTALVFLSACSSTHAVHTKSGEPVMSSDKPELDEDTGLLQYENAESGKKEELNKDEVKSLKKIED